MLVDRQSVIDKIEKMLAGKISREDIGWWAYELLMEKNLEIEIGYEKLLEDVLRSVHYFHDDEPVMQQFYPDISEIVFYLKCLKGEEVYQRSKVIHWKV